MLRVEAARGDPLIPDVHRQRMAESRAGAQERPAVKMGGRSSLQDLPVCAEGHRSVMKWLAALRQQRSVRQIASADSHWSRCHNCGDISPPSVALRHQRRVSPSAGGQSRRQTHSIRVNFSWGLSGLSRIRVDWIDRKAAEWRITCTATDRVPVFSGRRSAHAQWPTARGRGAFFLTEFHGK